MGTLSTFLECQHHPLTPTRDGQISEESKRVLEKLVKKDIWQISPKRKLMIKNHLD